MQVQEIISKLEEYITPVRKQTFEKVLQYRTRYFSVMLENIYQPHNASAVIRSCEAFGIQDIHIIEQDNTFAPNQEISMGSAKWVDIHRRDEANITESYKKLREAGYKIVATSLRDEKNTLYQFDISHPSVLVFGNELKGLSEEAIDSADETLYIPMFGFVESFNISVSVAIILSYLITQLHNSNINWRLTEEEKAKILLDWLRNDIHKADIIEQRFKIND